MEWRDLERGGEKGKKERRKNTTTMSGKLNGDVGRYGRQVKKKNTGGLPLQARACDWRRGAYYYCSGTYMYEYEYNTNTSGEGLSVKKRRCLPRYL